MIFVLWYVFNQLHKVEDSREAYYTAELYDSASCYWNIYCFPDYYGNNELFSIISHNR